MVLRNSIRSVHSLGKRDARKPVLDYAFAFDIDGVLMLGSNAIPAGARALKRLHEKMIPYILLTNGGGKYECDRVADLSNRLGVNVATPQDSLSSLLSGLVSNTIRFRPASSFKATHHTKSLPMNIPMSSFSHMTMRNAVQWLSGMGLRMSGQQPTSTLTSRTFGLSERIILRNSKTLLRINRSMLLSSSVTPRMVPSGRLLNKSDWGRDTQIIMDLALSPDRTFGNKSRLAIQARDGTGAAIILSA